MGAHTKRIASKRIATKHIVTKRIVTKHIVTKRIKTKHIKTKHITTKQKNKTYQLQNISATAITCQNYGCFFKCFVGDMFCFLMFFICRLGFALR